MNKKNKTLLSILILFCFLFINNAAYSASPEMNLWMNPEKKIQNRYNNESDIYYKNGTKFLNSHNYTKAVDAFLKVLKINNTNVNARINLSVAYINRGTYFYNELKNANKAANDYRNAIYFLKYDTIVPDSGVASENLDIAYTNLENLFNISKTKIDKDSRLKTAKVLRGQGKFRESLVEFLEVVDDTETNPVVLTDIGDMYSVLQNDKEALKVYKKALSSDKNNFTLRLKLAKALHNTGAVENAIKEFNIVLNTATEPDRTDVLRTLEAVWIKKLRENPYDASAHMNLGVVLQKKGDLDGAMKEYQLAESINPNDLTTRLNMGTLFQAKKNHATALRAYDTILYVKPEHLSAHYYKGTALKEMGRLNEAVKEFQFVLSKEPGNADAKEALFATIKIFPDNAEISDIFETFSRNNPEDATAQYKYALNLHAQGKYDEALKYYNKTIALNPEITDAYLNIATVHRFKKRYSEALAVLEKGLKAVPDNDKLNEMSAEIKSETANERYGNALDNHKKGKYAEAIKEYLIIIKESEPDSDLYLNLGAAYQASKKYNEAVNAYKKALAINNKNSTAFYYLGTVYSAQNKNNKAINSYNKALALDPSNKDIKNAITLSEQAINENNLQKGIDQYNKGKYSAALLTFNTLAMHSPSDAYLYYYRGMVNDALNKYRLAIADYKLAVKYRPDLNYAYYATAVDYDSLKNYAKAKKWYKIFVEKSGNQKDQYIEYAKERIKQL